MISDRRSRFQSCILGLAIGDAPGRPTEFITYLDDIREKYGPDGVTDFEPDWHPAGTNTDDTQMMIGVAESLIACGGFDGADMARRFVENYEPHRGYGAGAHQVLQALRDGCPWDRAATIVLPQGSFGNGAAMRVAPVGLLYHQNSVELRRVAELSASITHAHPLGKEGRALQANAAALAARSDPDEF